MSEAWDAIDPHALLPLVGVRRMSRDFGFLLRHYWLPATELTFERTTIRKNADSEPITAHEQIVRRMARCDADVCIWRETVDDRAVFCCYNRSEQTYRTKAITAYEALPESEKEARIQAFLHQPILTPLLPIPMGFQWHVATENGDYLDFTLESETTINDMSTLFIRRTGRFVLEGIGSVEREGVVAYALERSTVLEDRTRDVVVENGFEILTATKLVQSRLL